MTEVQKAAIEATVIVLVLLVLFGVYLYFGMQ
jgi:hypothetical protein